MSCSLDIQVKQGIVNKASEMLQQSGAFTIENNIAKVTDETIDYNSAISSVNEAFKEEVVRYSQYQDKQGKTLSEINTDFNRELRRYSDIEEYKKAKLPVPERLIPFPQDYKFYLGTSSRKLSQAGLNNNPIYLSINALDRHIIKDAKHRVDSETYRNIVYAIHNPIAIFKDKDYTNRINVLTELKGIDGKPVNVVFATDEKDGNYIVTSFQPVDTFNTTKNVTENNLIFIDKEKAKTYFLSQGTPLKTWETNSGTTNIEKSINIIKSFKNKISEDEVYQLRKEVEDEQNREEQTFQEGLNWLKQVAGENINTELVQGLIDGIGRGSYNTIEDLITLSEDFANKGTVKHEYGHKVFNSLSKEYREKLLNEGSKIFNIPRGKSERTVKYSKAQENEINYSLKAISNIQDNITKVVKWYGDKNVDFWNKLQTDLQIPKQQIELLKQTYDNLLNKARIGIPSNKEFIEEMLADFAANYSYTIEINTAKTNSQYSERVTYNPEDGYQPEEIYDEPTERNTQHYSNLTVNEDFYKNNPDWEYKEQRITTPLIIPSIKGHAQFAQANDIGWFRAWYNKKTGEVHVIEVQSDLFQKGRDKENLIGETSITSIKENENAADYIGKEVKFQNKLYTVDDVEYTQNPQSEFDEQVARLYLSDENGEYAGFKYLGEVEITGKTNRVDPKNQFLQLLNKDNNWVTFFVKSIIQDSAKKGYEKVLFPTGNTASKVEGHTTLEEFKKQKEDRIKELESNPTWITNGEYVIENSFFSYNGEIFDQGSKLIVKDGFYNIVDYDKSKILDKKQALNFLKEADITPTFVFDKTEINQLKQELERVEGPEGFGALRPIYNFYENTVANILNKTYGKVQDFSNTPIKQGVDSLFDENKELSKIGNQKQYSAYLDTIFPDSKVKDIVYHGTSNNDTPFRKGRNHFIGSFKEAENYANLSAAETQEFNNRNVIPRVIQSVININPEIINQELTIDEIDAYTTTKNGIIASVKEPTGLQKQFIVFEPKQIHILGNKQDIEGFKSFVKESSKPKVPQITDEYGNTWNEITINSKIASEAIKFQSPKLEYKGDLAIEEKIMEQLSESKDEVVSTTILGKFIQSLKNLLRNIFKEKDNISQFVRNINQGRFKTYIINPSDNLINKYLDAIPKEEQSITPIKEGVPELFESNPELGGKQDVEGFKEFVNKENNTLASIPELTPQQIIQNVITGFKLYPVKEGFGNIRFKSKNEKSSKELAKRINTWLKQKGWDNKVQFGYEATYKTINPFIKKDNNYSNGFGTIDSELESKYFSNGNATTSKQILESIASSTHSLASTAEILLQYADKINVPITLENNDTIGSLEKEIVYFNEQGEEVVNKINFTPAGLYDSNTKSISINKDSQFKGLGSEPTIIHEILHAYTNEFINTSDTNIIKELDDILEHLKKNASKISDKYAILNKDELIVAFFTNTSFIKDLQNIKALGKYNNYKNLWQQLYDYITDLFGFNSKEKSLYSEVYGLMTNIVEEGVNFEYNKNATLQQFYQDQTIFLNENNEITEEDWDSIWQKSEENSTSSMMIYASPSLENPNSKQYATFYKDALPSEFDRKSKGNFKNSEISKTTIEKVIKRLQKIFPDLKVKSISPFDLNQDEHLISINEINSFIKGDTIYLVEGRYTLENKVEEILHPFIQALKQDNSELFERLFESSLSGFTKEFEFYKSRFDKDVAKIEVVTKALQQKVLEAKSPSLLQEFIEYLQSVFQAIFPFSADSKKLTSDFSMDMTIEDLADLLISGGFNFRTDYVQNPYYNATDGEQWVEDSFNKLKEYYKNQDVIKVDDGVNNYYSRYGKKLIRITEIAEAKVIEFWKGKRQLTEEQESLRDLALSNGSEIHNAIEKIGYKLVDPETGLFRTTPINIGVNDTSLNDLNYKKIENLVIRRLQTYKDAYGSGTRFIFEQIIFNSKKNLAGTIDFIAITPDKKIHIRDWKTTQREKNPSFDATKSESKTNKRYIDNSKKPFKIWKRLAWDTQLSEYKDAISNIIGLKDSDFPIVRIDPILIEYSPDYKSVTDISTPVDDNVYSKNRQAIPYVSRAESMNNENLKDLFTKIREIARINIEKKSLETGRKFKYDYELDEQIEIMIQDFYLFNNFTDIYKLHTDTVIEVQKQLNQLSEIENVGIDNATFIMRELQIAKEYLNAIDSLIIGAQEIYGKDLDNSILTDREKEDSKKVQAEKDLLNDIKGYSLTLFNLNNKLNEERIRLLNSYGDNYGINGLEKVEKIVSGFEKKWTSTSTPKTITAALLYKVLKPVWTKLRVVFRTRKEKLSSLKYELNNWAKSNGETFKDAMLFFVDQEKGKLKSKFHANFYQDRTDVLQSGDLKRIKSFFKTYYKWDELKAKFDDNLNKEIEEIENANYSYSNKEELRKAIQRKIQYSNKKWNLDTSVDAYSYISLDYINETDEFKKNYYTDFYNEIIKKGNETLFNIYNYFIDINKKTFEAGGIDYNEIYTFIPKINKSLMEKGLKTLDPREIWDSMKRGVELNSNSEFGNVNLATGQVEKKHFIPYTQDIFAGDYSDMNFDLFATYTEFSEGMETAFLIKDLLPFANVLLDLEQSKNVFEVSKTGDKLKQGQGDNRGQYIPVKRDNNWKYLEMHIDAILYGKTIQDSFDHVFKSTTIVKKKDENNEEYEEEEVKYYSALKMIQGAMSWMYKNTFGLNFSTPVRQYVAGIGHQYFTSGRHFTGEDMAKNGRLLSSFINLVSSNKGVSNKKALALDYFMPYLDNEYKLQSKELSTNFSTRLFQPENLMFLMRKGTRLTQANIFMTLLDNFIVVNGKLENVHEYVRKKNKSLYDKSSSEEINKLKQEEEKEINKLKDENSIYNYLEVKEKEVEGKKVKYLQIKDLNEEYVLQKVQNLSMYYSKKITGENTNGDFYGYRASMLNRMAAMYRNWIPRTVQTRMGKFSYNAELDNYEWGRWGAFMSVLQESVKESGWKTTKYFFGLSKKQELIQYAKSKLEKIRQDLINNNREFVDFDKVFSEREFIDMYLENYKKSLTEFRMITLMILLLASGIMAPDDDDDQKTKALKRFANFQFDRMQDEFSFYVNIKSATEIAGNFLPSAPYMINVIKAVTGTGEEVSYTIIGNEKKAESNKPLKYWIKSVPVLNQFLLYYSLFEPETAKDLGIKPFTIRKL